MSTLKVDSILKRTGTGTISIGQSGDTVALPSATLTTALPVASGGTGGTSFSAAGLSNTPAFEANGNAQQSISDSTVTKLQFNVESFDLGDCYDHTTNYRFTPNIAGKYFIYLQCQFSSASDWDNNRFEIHKNGSAIATTQGRNEFYNTMNCYNTLDMNGSSDYVESFARQASGSSQNAALDDTTRCYFGAFRIMGS